MSLCHVTLQRLIALSLAGSPTESEAHAFSLAGWPANSQNVPVPASPNNGITLPAFYIDAGDSNSVPCAHTTRALTHGVKYPTTLRHC